MGGRCVRIRVLRKGERNCKRCRGKAPRPRNRLSRVTPRRKLGRPTTAPSISPVSAGTGIRRPRESERGASACLAYKSSTSEPQKTEPTPPRSRSLALFQRPPLAPGRGRGRRPSRRCRQRDKLLTQAGRTSPKNSGVPGRTIPVPEKQCPQGPLFVPK